MASEEERLKALLKDNKISQEEYVLLTKALAKPTLGRKLFSWLTNPYQKVAGFKALGIGGLIIVVISYFGSIAQVYFSGLLGILNASIIKNQKIGTDFVFLLYQNIMIWLVMSLLYCLAIRIYQKKNVRMIDVLGTVALSRYPYLLLTAFVATIRTLNPSFMNISLESGLALDLSLLSICFSSVVILCVIWHIATYFYALKESSGLNGRQLWISFIVSMLVGEVLCNFITMLPVSL
jgi:hypothetical protein